MPLSDAQRAILERLGPENVRQRLHYAGAGTGSVVPGISSPDVSRGDVEDWLALHDRKADKERADTLWWAKAAAIIGVIGIMATIVIAVSGH